MVSASPESFESMLSFFKALANEGRLRMVGVLAQAPSTVKELSAAIALSEPTVCHHLRVLQDAQLVSHDGSRYDLRKDIVFGLGRSILGKNGSITTAIPSEENWESRVLANYLDGETLMRIPASRRKLWPVLHWLIEKFSEGKRYPESMVNEMIQRHHPDAATLRRELVGYRMLDRTGGVYWRRPVEDWTPAAS